MRAGGAPANRRRPTLLAAIVAAAGVLAIAGPGCGGDEPTGGPGERGSERPGGASTRAGEGRRDRRVPPLRDGARLVFFGDSLATAGERPYPARVGKLIDAEVEVASVSEPGATARDCLPGSELFEQRLVPELAGADLVLVTLGGNDLERALGGADGFEALERARDPELARRLRPALSAIGRNLARCFAAIRATSPATGIVYVSYPDYSASERWQRVGGRLGALGLRAGLAELLRAAAEAGPDLVIDMRPLTADDAGELLDGEYLSEAGHAAYARTIVRRLR